MAPHERRLVGDGMLVVAMSGLDLVLFSTLLNAGPSSGARSGLLIGYAAVGGAILFWQRRRPVVGYAVLWLHALGSVGLTGYRPTMLLLIGLYTVAAQAASRAAVISLLACVAPIALAVADGVREAPPGEGVSTFVGISTLLVIVHCGAFGIGRWARSVRDRARALERGRHVAALDAVEVERDRIAGELHDTVAHSVTLMTLQAAGAKKMMRHDLTRAEEVLSQVGGTGVQAMSELRRMLGQLRPGDRTSLTHIEELLTAVRSAGVTVTLRREGTPVRLDPAVDLAAYRTVQEALTNAAKHAGPGTHASVALCWQARHVRIEVTDDGSGDPRDAGDSLSTGHGLAGLVDRVAGLGGRVESGLLAGGGFRVLAIIPIGAPAPTTLAQQVWSDDVAARSAG